MVRARSAANPAPNGPVTTVIIGLIVTISSFRLSCVTSIVISARQGSRRSFITERIPKTDDTIPGWSICRGRQAEVQIYAGRAGNLA